MGGLQYFLTILNQGLVLSELKTKLVMCIAGCHGNRYHHRYRMSCKRDVNQKTVPQIDQILLFLIEICYLYLRLKTSPFSFLNQELTSYYGIN